MSKSSENIIKKPWPYNFMWSYFDSIDYKITEDEFLSSFDELKKKSLNAFSEVARNNQEKGISATSKDVEKEVENSYLPKIIQEFIKGRKEKKESTIVVEEKKPKIKTIKLRSEEKPKFLDRFKNFGFSFGLFGGRRSKLKSAVDKAEFGLSKESVSITKNSQDQNLVQVTFDGNCDNVAMVSVGHNCYVKAFYNKENGLVDIVSSKVFKIGSNGEEKEIGLQKKGGFLGRLFGANGDLEKELGKSEASEVRKNFKNLKLLVCANPTEEKNSKEFSTSGVAALIDGKTSGIKMGKKTTIAAAVILAGAGTVAVLTGVGIIPGAAAIAGAATIAGSAIAKTSTTAAFATGAFAQSSANQAAPFIVKSSNQLAEFSANSYESASDFFQTDVGTNVGIGVGAAVGTAAALSAATSKNKPQSSAKKSSVIKLEEENKSIER